MKVGVAVGTNVVRVDGLDELGMKVGLAVGTNAGRVDGLDELGVTVGDTEGKEGDKNGPAFCCDAVASESETEGVIVDTAEVGLNVGSADGLMEGIQVEGLHEGMVVGCEGNADGIIDGREGIKVGLMEGITQFV